MALYVNGTCRAIEIDEALPIDGKGDLVCAAVEGGTTGQLWPALIEKAVGAVPRASLLERMMLRDPKKTNRTKATWHYFVGDQPSLVRRHSMRV